MVSTRQDSINILSRLTIQDINQEPETVSKFLACLEKDLASIIHSSDKPSKQTINHLSSLFTVAKEDKTFFSQVSLNKISALKRLVQDKKIKDTLTCFSTGIKIIIMLGVQKLERVLISAHMDSIINALNEKNLENVITNCIEFGTFFQKNFPGARLETIQKHLKHFIKYKNRTIPHFNFFATIYEAKIRLYERVLINDYNSKGVIEMDALSKGIAVFSTLMNNEQFTTHPANASDKIIEDVEKDMYRLLPSKLTVSMFNSTIKKDSKNFFKKNQFYKSLLHDNPKHGDLILFGKIEKMYFMYVYYTTILPLQFISSVFNCPLRRDESEEEDLYQQIR